MSFSMQCIPVLTLLLVHVIFSAIIAFGSRNGQPWSKPRKKTLASKFEVKHSISELR